MTFTSSNPCQDASKNAQLRVPNDSEVAVSCGSPIDTLWSEPKMKMYKSKSSPLEATTCTNVLSVQESLSNSCETINSSPVDPNTNAQAKDKRSIMTIIVCCAILAALFAFYVLLLLNKTGSSATLIADIGGMTVHFEYGMTFMNGVYVLLVLWIVFKTLRRLLLAISGTFSALSESHQRNTLTYLIELSWSTIVLIPLIYVFWVAYVDDHGNGQTCMNSGNSSLTYCLAGWIYQLHVLTVCGLSMYMYELVVRSFDMRFSLIVHHLAALIFTVFALTTAGADAETANIWSITLSIFPLMFALFEQPTFFALACYRLLPSNSAKNLTIKARSMWVGAAHFAVSKLISHILGAWYYIAYFDHLNLSMKIVFPVFTIILLPSQIYSAWAQYIVYLAIRRKANRFTNATVQTSAKSA
eukprot:CFRG5713T1